MIWVGVLAIAADKTQLGPWRQCENCAQHFAQLLDGVGLRDAFDTDAPCQLHLRTLPSKHGCNKNMTS
jgi:hypothetical protein